MQMFLQDKSAGECRLAVLSGFMDDEAARCSASVVDRGDGYDVCYAEPSDTVNQAVSPQLTRGTVPCGDLTTRVSVTTVLGTLPASHLFDVELRVEAHIMETSARLQRYVEMLGMVRDTCLICRVLGSSGVVTSDA
jgi:hypothetical protein